MPTFKIIRRDVLAKAMLKRQTERLYTSFEKTVKYNIQIPELEFNTGRNVCTIFSKSKSK